MSRAVVLPGGIAFRAAGADDQAVTDTPQWGVYGDHCWDEWPGKVLTWPDFGVPVDEDAAIAAILQAWSRSVDGQDVLVGCLGGTGRTGTLLACLAVLSGVPPAHAVDWVRMHYRRRAVEGPAQQRWITDRFARNERVKAIAAHSRTRLIDDHTARIRKGTTEARLRPEDAPILVWAVRDVLGVTQRPLRDHPRFGGSRTPMPVTAARIIEEWVDRITDQGIRSAIILTSNKELAYYEVATAHHGGLLGLYRHKGLDVEHLPADDPAHDTTAASAFAAAVDKIADMAMSALRQLPLPAVMHCSAAIDRSPPVAGRVAFLVADCGLL